MESKIHKLRYGAYADEVVKEDSGAEIAQPETVKKDQELQKQPDKNKTGK